MRIILQRVKYASVTINEKLYSRINSGFLALIGFSEEDNEDMLLPMAEKMINLRVFSDSNDKMNLALHDISGELLLVSQFTLYADCRKGRRPSFNLAAEPDSANALYEKFINICKEVYSGTIKKGEFGADMKIELLNDGPVTIILDSDEIVK